MEEDIILLEDGREVSVSYRKFKKGGLYVTIIFPDGSVKEDLVSSFDTLENLLNKGFYDA